RRDDTPSVEEQTHGSELEPAHHRRALCEPRGDDIGPSRATEVSGLCSRLQGVERASRATGSRLPGGERRGGVEGRAPSTAATLVTLWVAFAVVAIAEVWARSR